MSSRGAQIFINIDIGSKFSCHILTTSTNCPQLLYIYHNYIPQNLM